MTIAQKLEEKARQQTQREIACNLLKNGMDRSTVMSMTGLTESELKLICQNAPS